MSHYDFARDYLAREWAAMCAHRYTRSDQGVARCLTCGRKVDEP